MKKIGIYDSGSGGLSVLNHLINGGYAGEIYYYADTINNPGEINQKVICSLS